MALQRERMSVNKKAHALPSLENGVPMIP